MKNIDKVCIFTNTGNLHLIKVLDLPFGKFRDKGTPIDNVSNYDSKTEDFIYIMSLENVSQNKILFATKQSMLKLVDGTEFVVSRKTSQATKLAEDDEVIAVRIINGGEHLVMHSNKDYFLRIECDTIPEKKKMAVGVRGMKLDKSDELKDVYIFTEGENETVEVKGKELSLNRLKIGNRDTKGTKH